MAVQDGYSRYSCDVGKCQKVNYDKPGGTYAVRYVERKFIDANFQTRVVTLCTEHAEKFDALVRDNDAKFSAFMKDGTVPAAPATDAAATTDGKE